VTVRTHAGEIVRQMFGDPQYMQGVVQTIPFVFVEYSGRTTMPPDTDSTYTDNIHTLRFRLFVGASTLRTTKEGARNAYAMLRSIYDAIHGKMPYSDMTVAEGATVLSGVKIETEGFNALSPFMPSGAQDEVLLINMPKVCIYATEYHVRVLA
jgi:phage gp37-like protein